MPAKRGNLLTMKEASLLRLLVENKGKALPANEFWKVPPYEKRGNLWVGICRLRKKLPLVGFRVRIVTLPKYGYRLEETKNR